MLPSDDLSHSVSETRSRLSPLCLVSLVLCLCLAAALRTAQLTESLWLDELHTAWVVADGPAEICPRAAIGNQSPAYFLVVWAITQAGGLSEVSLRAPSVIAGVGLVLLAFYVAREWTGQNAAGVFAALLVALDRNCVFYAQEARPYAWVQLLALAHVFLFQRQVYQPDAAKRLALLALGVLLFYLHYTSVLLLAAEAVYYVLLHTRDRWHPAYHWRRYLLDMSVVGLCFLPASWHLIEIAARRSNWAMFIGQRPFLDIWLIFPLGTYVNIPLAVIVASFVSRWLVSRWSQKHRRAGALTSHSAPRPSIDMRHFLLTVCWLLIPLLLAWCLTAWDIARLFFARYVIICAVAPVLFSAICFAVCPLRVWRAVCVIGVVCSVVYQGGMIWQIRHDGRVIGDRNQDWRSAVGALNESSIDSTTPVFVRSGLIEAEGLRDSQDPQLRDYCLLPVRGIYRLRHSDDSLIPLATTRSGRLSHANRQRVLDAGTAWFLLAGGPRTTASIERELLTDWRRYAVRPAIAERRRFGLVAILRLELRAAIND